MRRQAKGYDNYDYETGYNKTIESLEEWELEQAVKRKEIPMIYRTTTTKAGNQIEVDIYPSFAHKEDIPRTQRKRESKPSQKNLNERRARRYLNQLVSKNFGEGDIWATFGYDNDNLPINGDDAQKIFTNYIRRVNRRRKKQGKENIRYICVTEYSEDKKKKIRCHHHVILGGEQGEKLNRDELESMWKHGKRTHTRIVTPDKDTHLLGLVKYITKDPKGKKRWTASKGLKKPVVTRSYSKFRKREVYEMVRDRKQLERLIQKKYPKCKFIDAEVKTNEINSGYYIYARLKRD